MGFLRDNSIKISIPKGNMNTRRKFLRDCSLIATATALVPAVLAQTQTKLSSSLGAPGYAQFRGQLNTRFLARAGARALPLQLVDVQEFAPARHGAEDAHNERFSLLFSGPANELLGQDTHVLEHAALGEQVMFIVPVGAAEGTARHYEAIFNRPMDRAGLAGQVARAPRRGLKTGNNAV